MRRDRKHVTTGERAAEQRHAVGVAPLEAARIDDRGAIILVLLGDVEQLARLAVTCAEMAVVEQQHPDSGVAEALGVGIEAQLARGREAVRHHDDRRRAVTVVGPVQPGRAVGAGGREGNVVASHAPEVKLLRTVDAGAP